MERQQSPSSDGAGWSGGEVTAWAEAVLAPNPGPMTLEGTNTWILQRPGAATAVVVDPGPLDDGHLAAVHRRVQERGAQVAAVLVTHHHHDHVEGADRFVELAGGVLHPPGTLEGHPEGDLSGLAGMGSTGLGLIAVPTPGHTADSTCLLLPEAGVLLTGDTVLGRGTTVIARPDGSLAAYLDSLDLLLDLVGQHDVRRLLPGHGPARDTPQEVIAGYRSHRHARLEEVRAAVARGAVTAADVVREVYTDVPEALLFAAEFSVQAQLDYLAERG